MTFFLGGHFEIFSSIFSSTFFYFILFSSYQKDQRRSYEVSFFSVLWMVSSES